MLCTHRQHSHSRASWSRFVSFIASCLNGVLQMHADPREVESTNILDILLNSILDHPEDSGAENEMRYKLIIDCSEDGLLVRLLFSSGVLLRDKTKIYMCSDFPGDMELQKVRLTDYVSCIYVWVGI